MTLDSYTLKPRIYPSHFMLRSELTRNVIAPRRQAPKEKGIVISPNLGVLCDFARAKFNYLG